MGAIDIPFFLGYHVSSLKKEGKRMKQNHSIREVYREGSGFRYFLLCILITGLSSGLYKGMLDNYLAEVVKMGDFNERWKL